MALTTVSIITLQPGHARWALARMGTGPALLAGVPGLRFAKLLGSGAANGFGLWPNWRRYGLLAVWDDAAAATAFFTGEWWQDYLNRSAESCTMHLRPLQAHGQWSGVNPFEDTAKTGAAATNAPLAVLTRASISWRKVPRFWRFVAPTSAAVADAAGVRLAIGLGEMPVMEQATFSIWESAEAMRQYAYHDARHREVMQLTRREGWYSEELFARFEVLSSTGTVDGKDPMAGLIMP